LPAQLKKAQAQTYWDAMPVAFFSNGSIHYQHQDWLGTERSRTGYNGAVEGTYNSLPFGDGFSATGADSDPYHFAMLDHDSESSTEHAQFRQYSPAQGRWMSPDPYDGSYHFGNPQSFNRYSYVKNNPLGRLDPLGLDSETGIVVYNNDGSVTQIQDLTSVDVDGGADSAEGVGGGNHFDRLLLTVLEEGPPSAPNNGTPGNQVSPACQAQLLNMINTEHGTNATSANITDFYNNGTAANIIVDISGLTAAQFNSFQPGRYSTYGGQFLLGFGMAGHIANEPGVNAGAVFSNSNIGGNLSVHFAFHDDHGYANNPFGALIHFFTDVLGHNSRKPC
jgi:RHS repeat-associated protein